MDALALTPAETEEKCRVWWVIRNGIEALRTLHSGHVGDYVAFIAFGAAAFGILLRVLIMWAGW